MRLLKRITYILGIFVILVALIPKEDKVHASTQYHGAALIDKLEVRVSPSKKSRIIGYLKERSKLTVYSKLKNGWSLIQYKSKKGYVETKYVIFFKNNSSTPSAKVLQELGQPLVKNSSYKFKEGGRLLSVDLFRLSKVSFEKTWNPLVLDYQMKSIVLAIGSNTADLDYSHSIDFISGSNGHDGYKLDNYSWIDAVFENSLDDDNNPNGFQGLRMYFIANHNLMEEQAEYILKFMLKPYFPTGYKKLAEEYVSGERYHNIRTDKEWRKIDGLNVRIFFDFASAEIEIAQKYKSKKTIFAN